MENYLVENTEAWAKVGQRVQQLDSTNLELQRQLSASILSGQVLPEGYSIRADYQSQGKGQLKRSWEGDPGDNLAVSFLLSGASLNTNRLFAISQNISLAVREVIEQITNRNDVTVKWPNDVYVGQQKIAGILIETSIKGYRVSHVICGIGINVNQLSFQSAPNATSIALILGKKILIDQLFERLANKLQERHQYLKDSCADPYEISREYHAVLYGLYKRLTFRRVSDGLLFSAKLIGVTSAGKLRLETTMDEQLYSVGELVFSGNA